MRASRSLLLKSFIFLFANHYSDVHSLLGRKNILFGCVEDSASKDALQWNLHIRPVEKEIHLPKNLGRGLLSSKILGNLANLLRLAVKIQLFTINCMHPRNTSIPFSNYMYIRIYGISYNSYIYIYTHIFVYIYICIHINMCIYIYCCTPKFVTWDSEWNFFANRGLKEKAGLRNAESIIPVGTIWGCTSVHPQFQPATIILMVEVILHCLGWLKLCK